MIRKILLSVLLFSSLSGYCTYYVSVADGDWESPSTWSPPQVPQLDDTTTHIQVYHDLFIPLNGQYNVRGHLTINTGGSVYTPNQFRVNGGHVVVWGYLNVHNNLWMENGGVMEVWYGGFVFVDNKITYNEVSTILLRGGTICWHNLWKGDPPEGVGVMFNDPHLTGINGCYLSTGPLGISLLSFDVRCNDSFTEIQWVTENEENNDHFTIEKSNDLQHWELVTTYPGSLSSTGRLEYSVMDDDPQPGIFYYRLSQTDVGGNTTVFGDEWLRYSNCYKVPVLSVFPVPVTNELNIYGLTDNDHELMIYDVFGSMVLKNQVLNAVTHLDVSSLVPGMYMLVTELGNSQKFIKE